MSQPLLFSAGEMEEAVLGGLAPHYRREWDDHESYNMHLLIRQDGNNHYGLNTVEKVSQHFSDSASFKYMYYICYEQYTLLGAMDYTKEYSPSGNDNKIIEQRGARRPQTTCVIVC